MDNLQARLQDGEVVTFSSPDHLAEASFSNDSGWQGGYKIWFNGTYIHASKTFKSFERKLNQLVADRNLREDHKVA